MRIQDKPARWLLQSPPPGCRGHLVCSCDVSGAKVSETTLVFSFLIFCSRHCSFIHLFFLEQNSLKRNLLSVVFWLHPGEPGFSHWAGLQPAFFPVGRQLKNEARGLVLPTSATVTGPGTKCRNVAATRGWEDERPPSELVQVSGLARSAKKFNISSKKLKWAQIQKRRKPERRHYTR